jgi:hypothetical protein
MSKEVLFLVEDADEGGYIARALGHSIFTEADSWDELKRAIREAVQCHFDAGQQPDLILSWPKNAIHAGFSWSAQVTLLGDASERGSKMGSLHLRIAALAWT